MPRFVFCDETAASPPPVGVKNRRFSAGIAADGKIFSYKTSSYERFRQGFDSPPALLPQERQRFGGIDEDHCILRQ
jgi:hypothetical protein